MRSRTRPDYDIAIIGGGIAGTALAAATAEGGLRTIVLEGSHTYSDRVRGEWLAPWGVGEARALGLLDSFGEAGAHRLPGLVGRGGKARPQLSPAGDVPLTFYHPRLQRALASHASAAGATVTHGARVGRLQDDGRQGGGPSTVEFELAGVPRSLTASVVVGADGRSSPTRRALPGKVRVHRSARMLAGLRLRGVVGDPSEGYFLLRDDTGGLASLFPQGGGYARSYLFESGQSPATYRGEAGLRRFIDASIEAGIPADVFAHAEAAGPLASFLADDSWVVHPATDSVALVGDAAGVSDPTWGMGLALSLRDARVLSRELLGARTLCEALHRYAGERDRYYAVIRTAENWNSELLLSGGEEARERRRVAQRAWRREPDRIVDFVAEGPEVDVSELARRRFFAEDLDATGEAMPEASPSSSGGAPSGVYALPASA